MWDGVRPALADAGFETIAPDLPGTELELGFPAWAQRVLGTVGGDFVPVGSSMGGYLAFELWRQAPRANRRHGADRNARDAGLSRAAGSPRGLDPPPRRGRPGAVLGGARPAPLRRPRRSRPSSERRASRRSPSRSPGSSPPRRPFATASTLARACRRSTCPSSSSSEEDRLTPPSDAEAMVAELPNARFSRIAGAGHLVPLRAAGRCGRAAGRLPRGGHPLTGDELAGLMGTGEVALLDVRSTEEYQGLSGYPCDPHQGHIPGAAHLDLNELYAAGGDHAAVRRFLAERGIPEGRRVVTYCHSGQRSELGRRPPALRRSRRSQLRGLAGTSGRAATPRGNGAPALGHGEEAVAELPSERVPVADVLLGLRPSGAARRAGRPRTGR